MKKMFSKSRWIQLIYGLILLVAGVLTVIFPVVNIGNFQLAVSIIVAVCLFILGIVYVVSSFITDLETFLPPALLLGAIAIAGGIIFSCNTTFFSEIVVYLVGALLVSYGVVIVAKGISFIIIKAKVRYVIIYMTLGLAALVLGILALVYNQQASQVVYIGVGVIIAIYGLYNMIYSIVKMVKNSKDKKVVATQDATKVKEIENK